MNRVVLITGASRGLGLSFAERFLAKGDTVYGISKTRRYWAEARKKLSCPEKLSLHCCDVSSETQVKRLVQSIKKKAGRIDILINNAGYAGKLYTVDKHSAKEIEKNFSINLFSAFYLSKHVIPLMRKRKKGLILNISSMAGTRAVPRLFAYSASKFGMTALTQCIAKENGDKGIDCLTICPGGMNTKMRSDLFGKADAKRQQSTDFVADVTLEIIDGKMPVPSGSDVIIRHGKLSAVKPMPLS